MFDLPKKNKYTLVVVRYLFFIIINNKKNVIKCANKIEKKNKRILTYICSIPNVFLCLSINLIV